MPTKIASRIVWNFVPLNNDLTEILIYDKIADKKSYNWWTDEEGNETTPISFKEELDKVTTSQVCVRINSGGGDVFAAEAIRTAIREKRQEGKNITCKVDGFCGSAAVGIAASCESTAISSSAWFMVHDPMVFLYGYYNIIDLNKGLNMANKIKQGIINAYTIKTGKDKEEISNLMTKETWYTGDEAVKEGFCDELMFEDEENDNQAENVVNLSPFDVKMYRNLPTKLLNHYPYQQDNGFSNKLINNTNKKEESNMSIKTVDDLKTAYPNLVKEVQDNATTAERNRIKNIEEMALNGYEEIVKNAKYDNPIAAADVAMKIVAEQKKQGDNYLDSRDNDVKNSNLGDVGNENHEDLKGKDDNDNPYDAAIDKLFPDVN